MSSFKSVTLESLPLLKKYFENATQGICDYTPATAVMWRERSRAVFAEIDETLLVKICYGSTPGYMFPVGKNIDSALSFAAEDAKKTGAPLVFSVIVEDDLKYLCDKFDIASAEYSEDWSDYVYPCEQFLSYSGKKLSGQRNHVNRFNREHPDWYTEIICADNLTDVKKFLEAYKKEASSETYEAELLMTRELLCNYEIYGGCGLALYCDGRVAAFAVGEIIGETLFVHIEKADRGINGAYAKIASEFVRNFSSEGIKFVNREEDTGDLGLRKSKLAYHPSHIIKKYTVRVK